MRVIIDIHIEQIDSSYDPPTKEDIKIGIYRQLQGYDNVVRGCIIIDNIVDIIDIDKKVE